MALGRYHRSSTRSPSPLLSRHVAEGVVTPRLAGGRPHGELQRFSRIIGRVAPGTSDSYPDKASGYHAAGLSVGLETKPQPAPQPQAR
jgi:hypothetical protein